MNSKSLRRLAADHANLHNQPLPPNYLFQPQLADSDDLASLDILLAGPECTPFAAGVWKLHLTIPPNYPEQPPTAHFRTPIFHPNVDPQTGGVCVETLKRDWEARLTLRDVLVTICCLLIQPNPDSALNAEAGALIQEGYDCFARRAELMTGIQAKVRRDLKDAVKEAQMRGQEAVPEGRTSAGNMEFGDDPLPPMRQQARTKRQNGRVATRRSDGSPSEAPARHRHQADIPPSNRPFVFQAGNDDIFGFSSIPTPQDSFDGQEQHQRNSDWDDSTMLDMNQENDETKSPSKPLTSSTRKGATPKRPHGAAVPLGELTMEEYSDVSSEDMEPEYPPSPRKSSPSKSPVKQVQRKLFFETGEHGEGSRNVLSRAPNATPPNVTDTPLALDSELSISIQPSPSPRKLQRQRQSSVGLLDKKSVRARQSSLFGSSIYFEDSVVKKKSPESRAVKDEKAQRAAELDAKLWKLCGENLERWNRGDFEGDVFRRVAGRW